MTGMLTIMCCLGNFGVYSTTQAILLYCINQFTSNNNGPIII